MNNKEFLERYLTQVCKDPLCEFKVVEQTTESCVVVISRCGKQMQSVLLADDNVEEKVNKMVENIIEATK